MRTIRYLMTDHHRGAAYVQDWTLRADGEVEDVAEVEDLGIADALSRASIAARGRAGRRDDGTQGR